jgi:hypothetical protein
MQRYNIQGKEFDYIKGLTAQLDQLANALNGVLSMIRHREGLSADAQFDPQTLSFQVPDGDIPAEPKE